MVRVKICGMTRVEDVREAAEAGADYVGVLLRESPRQVSWEQAERLVREAHGFPRAVRAVAVLAVPDLETVSRVAALGFDVAQLHGDESPAQARALRQAFPALELWKALAARSEEELRSLPDFCVDAYLLESGLGGPGGTGRRAAVPEAALRRWSGERRCLLAGGLDEANVAAVIRAVRPWGVDVSSGVEARPGVKDGAKVRAFVARARAADRETSPA